MHERLRGLMAEVFGVDASALPEPIDIEQMPEWDSLRHLELMLALEMEFDVQISSEIMPALLSLDAIEDYLAEQGVAA